MAETEKQNLDGIIDETYLATRTSKEGKKYTIFVLKLENGYEIASFLGNGDIKLLKYVLAEKTSIKA